jgi:hypothetical protein
LTLFLAAVFSFVLCSSPRAENSSGSEDLEAGDREPNLVEFKSDEASLPFEIKYPGSWSVWQEQLKIGDLGQTPVVFLTREPIKRTTDTFKVGITVIHYQNYLLEQVPPDIAVGPGASPRFAIANWEKVKKNIAESYAAFPGKTVLSTSDMTIAGLPAFRLISEKGETHQETFCVKFNADIYSIICEAPIAELPEYADMFKEIIGAVKLKPGVTLKSADRILAEKMRK